METPRPLLSLSPLERDALCILATFMHPVSRSHWADAVRTVNLRADETRALQGPPFVALVERLVSAGAIAAEPRRTGDDYYVPPWLVPAALEDARARGRVEALLRPLLPRDTRGLWHAGGTERILRISLALGDPERIAAALRPLAWSTTRRGELSVLVSALTPFAPAAWIARLPDTTRADFLRDALHFATLYLAAPSADVLASAAASTDPEIVARAAIVKALRGDVAGARACLPGASTNPWTIGALAVVELVEGRWAEAIAQFERAALTKQGVRRVRGLPSYLAVFDLLLAASPAGRRADAAGLAARVEGALGTLEEWPHLGAALEALATFRVSGRSAPVSPAPERATWLEKLVCALARRWTSERAHAIDPASLAKTLKAAEASGFTWVLRQLRAVHHEDEGTLAALATDSSPWELALEALSSAVPSTSASGGGASDCAELVWVVTTSDLEYGGDSVRVTPRLAKKRGQLGTAVSLDRLETDSSLPVQPEDRALVAAVTAPKRRRRHMQTTAVPLRTLLLVAGHPRLRDERGRPLVIERGVPEVRVEATSRGARLAVFPSDYPEEGVAVHQEPGRIVLFERTETAARLAMILGGRGIEVPKKGLARAAETLATLGPHVVVRGVEALGEAAGARVEPADGRLRVQLFRAGQAFRARLRVVPGGDEGPALRPGVEPAHVLVAGKAGPRSVARDLGAERACAERALEACPLLAALPLQGDDRVAEDLETCLELLLELAALRGDDVVVEWPEGQALHAPITRDTKDLRVRVGGEAQWLAVEAKLEVDEHRVVAFGELLERASAARGRFVPLGDGEYLALTEKLREQIDALGRVHALSDKHGRASLAMLPAIAQWADGADLALAETLRARLEGLQRALDATPRTPRALQAELRDYQRDGFVFLARRASSGLGSCLADDMGLGKTVQALALLVARSKEGPALVVAPTSVCRNWEDEARRFAPTLTLHRLAGAADRAVMIASLRNGDVLLASYGLLGPCAEALAQKRFATAVFDEAHALKNPDTRRAAAARSVAADAVVGLTGTPLENHLGELHALFDVLAPGLLGTRDRFERAFAAPIGRGDKRATAQLRALVRPFLLRRTKSQVLDELPEKTEITRLIAPSDAERAFYEAVRQRAVARVQQVAKTQGSQARITVLAEITKLRRAAVDPRLVGGDDAPAGSKLDALAELVSELREEGHRALVFSQFLEVLDRAGELLASRGVRCVRLDGTMTPAVRAAAVDAFQSGQADVFLLSLRAGGVGMNLTAADYVIHLDPWWNPAVEDQATDRAHRIGQVRPVTVVRLVSEGTIEEKVLRLHASKRALYADALGELDSAKKLDVAALAELLKDDGAPLHASAGQWERVVE